MLTASVRASLHTSKLVTNHFLRHFLSYELKILKVQNFKKGMTNTSLDTSTVGTGPIWGCKKTCHFATWEISLRYTKAPWSQSRTSAKLACFSKKCFKTGVVTLRGYFCNIFYNFSTLKVLDILWRISRKNKFASQTCFWFLVRKVNHKS